MNARIVSNVHTMLNVEIPTALTNVVVMMVIMATEKPVKVRLLPSVLQNTSPM